ncbi:FAD-dependent oxidoreductase [Paenibacillus arenilitoris]|uniref:FAD-dependent oxidoreductase n=1 Tax=Paenibacillus arenilitoris TaxID=2772299 RepID=A0A927CUH9_9BACL|nr:FAD-dependent oxidoreductase [Paenibacillus arenilitoris]MBD2872096.1 FAD-dependent oxidoreductase [Paenibacillus arenilitoris]
MTNSKAFPQYPESYWIESVSGLPTYPELKQHAIADVAVVGGGISGITTAYLLAKEGYKVVLLEAGKLLSGTTGHTTAKLTAQHDLIYDELIGREGREKAALYYSACTDALRFIRSTLEQHRIECGYSAQDAYIFTNSDDYIAKLEKEMAAYSALGIPGSYVDKIPLNIPVRGAVVMRDQAQFHPLQYLSALLRQFAETGGEIFEHTAAVDVEAGDSPKVVTSAGYRITCTHVVCCTHFPFYDGYGFYFARMHADRSYVLGMKMDEEYPGGMYLSAEDPKRSVRYADMGDQGPLVLVGGQSHKTGQGVCTINHYEELKRYAAEHFRVKEFPYRWSAQDLVTGDKLPYIGRITASSPNIYVATGYRKWGMTNGTAAAMLVRDLIKGVASPYEELYAPSRSVTMHAAVNLIADNADVAKHLIAGKIGMVHKRPEELRNDEGSVVKVRGRRAGAYKDKDGKLFLVDTTCTHMGCEVEWNDGDRTWDCPCHGSRFSICGEVIEGPAQRPLMSIAGEPEPVR